MAEKKSTKKSAKRSDGVFTTEERAAMKEYIRERRGRRTGPGDGESDVQAKIAAMQSSDRVIAQRLHAIMKAHAPTLSPKTWYGMPAYARDGEVVCFFQPAEKFGARYATLGFSDEAKLDDGHMWPTVYALTEMTATEEARIVALLHQALSG